MLPARPGATVPIGMGPGASADVLPTCPLSLQGSYSLPESNIELPEVELPSWLTNGNYRVQAVISSDGNQLACMKVTFSLQS